MKTSLFTKQSALKIIFAVFIFSIILLPASDTLAQNTKYQLLEPLPCVETPPNADGTGGVSCEGNTTGLIEEVDFKGYVAYMYNLVIALAAVAAVFMIVWGGFEYMTTDSYQGKSDGKDKLTNAVLGLVLVLASYLILKTIDPRLVQIPATLVDPLADCSNENDRLYAEVCTKYVDDFFNHLANNDATNENPLLRQNIAQTQAEVRELDQERKDILEDISLEVGRTVTVDNVDSVCSSPKDPVSNLSKFCVRYVKNMSDRNEKIGSITVDTTRITLNRTIDACISRSVSAADCITASNRQADDFAAKLKEQGISDAKIQDYKKFAELTIESNKVVLEYNPDAAATIKLIKNASWLVPAIGVQINTIGAIGSIFLPKSVSTSNTISYLESRAERTKDIRDPEIRAKATSHIQSLINGVRKP